MCGDKNISYGDAEILFVEGVLISDILMDGL